MKNKKRWLLAGSLILIIMISIRIVYVNAHVRKPELHSVTQKESLEYRGNEYRIQKVNLWEYIDYCKANPDLQQYMDAEEMERCRVIEVKFQLWRKKKKNIFLTKNNTKKFTE